MYRGTTPTLVFNINTELDLNTISEVWVTFGLSPVKTYTKEDVEISDEDKTITLHLSQEETLKFNKHDVPVQLRFLLDDGQAYASPIKSITVNDILQNGVISHVEEEPGDDETD